MISRVLRSAARLLPALLISCASTSGSSPLATKYQKASFIGTGGYRDKEISADEWTISADANGVTRQGFAQDMAMYRAAELSKSKGFAYFQILKQTGSTRMIGIGTPTDYSGQNLEIKIKGINNPDSPISCEAKVASLCMIVSVDKIMSTLSAALNISAK